MTTLLVSDIFPPKTGGSGRWFWEIYRRWPRARLVIAAGEDPRQTEFDRNHDLPVVRLPLTVPSRSVFDWHGLCCYWRSVRQLLRLARERQIQVVHCGRCLPEGLMARALKFWTGLPYLCYAHGEDVNLPRPDAVGPDRGVLASRQLRWLTGLVLRGADFVIANSGNTAHILRDAWGLPPERVRLLHPGVDTEYFVPAPRDTKVRNHLGWGSRPVVLTVSRLQLRKGHDRMIRALHAVREAVPDVLYAIVGEGEERPALRDLVQREGLGNHVQFLGEVSDADLRHCYQQCDLFVLPNRQVGSDIEGFGMVLLEAQACGRPVVAGQSGGTGETMNVPETGRLVNCDGPEELAAVVIDLLRNESARARTGRAARQWVVERFDWSALSRQAAELFGIGEERSRPLRDAESSAALSEVHG
jgi:phosphatidylinositol alpha-1,6-mannosyltransferase